MLALSHPNNKINTFTTKRILNCMTKFCNSFYKQFAKTIQNEYMVKMYTHKLLVSNYGFGVIAEMFGEHAIQMVAS